VGIASWYLTNHSGLLSLAILPWVRVMRIENGLGLCGGRNGEFRVTGGSMNWMNSRNILVTKKKKKKILHTQQEPSQGSSFLLQNF